MAKNWAIAIGINHYFNLQPLKYAKRDAESMRDFFKQAGFDEVFLFTDNSETILGSIPTQPTYGNLRRFLRFQFEKPLLGAGDNLWFFFAGHGIREAERDYLMPCDVDPGDVEHTAIPISFVTERLRRSGADNVILLLDACRHEGARSGLGIGEERHPGIVTIASCSPQQWSWEIEELEQGSFTAAVLEALRIQGEGNCATVERLYNYLLYRVPEINRQYQKPRQTPYAIAEPATKLHLILLPRQATQNDIATLREDASEAELEGDLELAEQLWTRVLAVSPADPKALRALRRIWRQAVPTVPSQPEPVTSQPGTRSSTPASPQELASPSLSVFEFDVVTVNAKGRETNRRRQQAKYFTENLGNGVNLEMVAIPGGSFLMGSPETEAERFDNESPQHSVTVQPFFMGKYPITQAQWRVVASLPQVNRPLEPDPSDFKGDDRPVERVSWYDAVEFCDRLSRLTKREYRLPSEAEWEYAARAGTTTPFHFGETITTELANYNGNYTYGAGSKGKYHEQTTPVGSFQVANAFGLYDMHGNLWEWCADHWHSNYQGAPRDGSAWVNENDNDNHFRLLRGGSWYYNPEHCRAACRHNYNPDYRYHFIGFRVMCATARTL